MNSNKLNNIIPYMSNHRMWSWWRYNEKELSGMTSEAVRDSDGGTSDAAEG